MPELILHEVYYDVPAVQRLLAEWSVELASTESVLPQSAGSTVRASDFVPPGGAFLLAVEHGSAVSCGGIRRLTDVTGELKRLFVAPAARGRGIGRFMLEALEQRARELGFSQLRLDTAGNEAAALELFRAAGYEEIPDYNGNPRARHWFAKQL